VIILLTQESLLRTSKLGAFSLKIIALIAAAAIENNLED